MSQIPEQVTEALTAALIDGVDAKTALKLALEGYVLVQQTPYSPALGFVPCLEEAVRRCGADLQTAATMLDRAFVISPRIHFEKLPDNQGFAILRGTVTVGNIHHWQDGDQYFLNIPGHDTGDMPGIRGEMRAKQAAHNLLDNPA